MNGTNVLNSIFGFCNFQAQQTTKTDKAIMQYGNPATAIWNIKERKNNDIRPESDELTNIPANGAGN